MLVKNIKFTDYFGVERNEEHYFNLDESEILEMQLGINGGFSEVLKRLVQAKDQASLISNFKTIILKAYGVVSVDGTMFDKSEELTHKFVCSPAYSALFMELVQDDLKAAEFINGIVPSSMKLGDDELKKIAAGELPDNVVAMNAAN